MLQITLIALAAIGGLAVVWRLYMFMVPSKAHDLPGNLDIEVRGNGGGTRDGGAAERYLSCGEVMASLSAHLAAPKLNGNRVELLVNGDRIFRPMLEAIRSARSTIDFLTYIYWRGEIARQCAVELSEAARRGVEVRVLLDAFGALKMRDELYEQMEQAGCHIAHFHPLRVKSIPHYNNRTHRKVLVVDGSVGFTGGVGIADEWTGDAQDADHWRDNHFRIEGPAVRYLQGAFAENWREATGEVLCCSDVFPSLPWAGSSQIVPIKSEPGGTVSTVAFTYWLLLRAARERAWITTPYFLPSDDLESQLIATARRGVDVSILLPGSKNDYALVQYGSETYYEALVDAGIRVYEFLPTMIHAKSFLIDDDLSLIGSPNFDNRSFDLNYEIAMCVADRRLNRQLASQFQQDLARSMEVTKETLASYSHLRRLRNRAALALRPQL